MHPIAKLTDEELVSALLRYAPTAGKEALRDDFTKALYRYRAALEEIPDGNGRGRLLDVGARLYTATVYLNLLHYAEVGLVTKWKTSYTDEALRASIPNGDRILLDHFDAEIDAFPYPDASFDVIVCTEVIEHLALDPMHMLAEMSRVCRKDGLLIMTTPNAASFDALMRIVAGHHPYSWAPYSGQSTDRHNREYTINELERVVTAAGFEPIRSTTISDIALGWKHRLLSIWFSLPDLVRGKSALSLERMGQTSLVVAKKVCAVRERYPGWLYYDAQRAH